MNTFAGSKLTRPQARAATPVQPCEIATIPMESGPGYMTEARTEELTKMINVQLVELIITMDYSKIHP